MRRPYLCQHTRRFGAVRIFANNHANVHAYVIGDSVLSLDLHPSFVCANSEGSVGGGGGLRICAGSPEPSLLVNAISRKTKKQKNNKNKTNQNTPL